MIFCFCDALLLVYSVGLYYHAVVFRKKTLNSVIPADNIGRV